MTQPSEIKFETHGEGVLLREIASAMRTPGVRTLSEFAEQEIRLPTGPYEGLLFKLDRHPVARLLFAELESGRWRRAFITGPNQDGKSLLGFVIPTAYLLFERCETVILGVPSGEMVADKWRDDLLPVIRASRYRDLLPKKGSGSRGGDVTSVEFANGAVLRFMTAGGDDQSRAAYTTPNVVVTETDGFDEVGGKSREGDKFSQLERRLLAFPANMRRLIAECTVSTEQGRTWSEYNAGSASRIAMRCPHCSKWVTPEREHLVGWQDAASEIEAAENSALTCPACGVLWTNEQRINANANAVLIHKGQSVDESGKVVGDSPKTNTLGFRWSVVNSVLDPDRLRTVGALEWRCKRAVDEDAAERDLCQSQWAKPSAPEAMDLSAIDAFSITRRVRPGVGRGICPAGTQIVTVGTDIGKWLCHWVAIAWIDATTPHVIDYGRIEVPSDTMDEPRAIQVALKSWADEISGGWQNQDKQIRPALHLIDSRYQEEAIRSACSTLGDLFWPSMGFGSTQKRIGEYKRKTGSKAVAVGDGYSLIQDVTGHRYFEVNSDHWKTKLHTHLRAPVGSAGSLTLFEWNNHLSYAKHLCSERQVEEFEPGKGTVTRWELMTRNNHYLDATVLACVAAHIVGMRPTEQVTQPARPQQSSNFVTAYKGRW